MSIRNSKKKNPVTRAKTRLLFTGFIFFIIFGAIGFRLADLTLSNYFRTAPAPQTVAEVKKDFNGYRATLADRNGKVIASSIKVSSLFADASLIKDPDQTTKKLLTIFPKLNKKRTLKNLSSKKRFVWIKRHITPKQKDTVNRLGIPGLEFKEEYRRIYPQGRLFSHLIGYTNTDNLGISGLEKGIQEKIIEQKKPIELTFDVNIQHIVKDELAKAIKAFNAKAGTGIVMDVKSGEVLSLVSMPDFDPHAPGTSKANNMFNRATLGVYEMGSTFKIFSAAAGLEFANIRMKDRFDCTKPIKYGRFTIRDFHAQKRIMSVPEIFMHSSNIGHVKIAEKVGTDPMKSFFNDLGFFDRLDIELPEAGRPLVPHPWRDINTVTASYGHGIAISPLHLVSGAASIVNGGTKITPRLIKEKNHPQKNTRLISEKTSHAINEMLRLTVLEGTGKNGDVSGFLVGGKTGTSEKASKGGYNKKALMASFLATFPVNNPQYIIYIMVDEPIGNQRSYGYATGGWVAAPAVQNIIHRMTSILGIPPLNTQQTRSFDLSMTVNKIPRKKKGG